MNREIKTYSAEDFIRYHRGEMTNAEMYALERAASEDPFLEDALEGYAYAAQPAAELADLRDRLSAKKSAAKVIPLQKTKNTWWRVAAAVIFIGAAAFFFNKFSQQKDAAPSLAKTEIKTEQKVNPAIVAPDTVPVTAAVPQKQTPPVETVIASTTIKSSGRTIKSPLPPDNNADDDLKQITARKDIAASPAAVTYDSLSYNRSGISAEAAKKDMYAKTADAGYNANAIDNIQIKSTTAKAKYSPAAVTGTRLNPDSITQFDRYVSSNIRMPAPEENSNVSYKGNVVLSFRINKKGKPVKIKTEKTVCGACDKEAVRLLKEGPDWEYDPNNNRKTVTIPF